jgi:ADP-ribose pyrophosphatase YjhB (NUDIX family)
MRFCPMCAARLEERVAFGRARPVCPGCGYVAFRNPKIAAGVVVERDGYILLTQRAQEPGRGCWGLPAGYMEWDETAEQTAIRETQEETGLVVTPTRLVGVYSYPVRGVVLIVFAADTIGGELAGSDECQAVGFFRLDALPPLAFDENRAIIADWRR